MCCNKLLLHFMRTAFWSQTPVKSFLTFRKSGVIFCKIIYMYLELAGVLWFVV